MKHIINRDSIFKDNVDYLLIYRENLLQTKRNQDNQINGNLNSKMFKRLKIYNKIKIECWVKMFQDSINWNKSK